MAYVETYRTVVAPSDCDVLNHMNVSGYFQACSDGVFSLQTNLGLGLSDIRDGRKLSFAVVRASLLPVALGKRRNGPRLCRLSVSRSR